MVLQTPDRQGWFWYIPQHDNVVSVGVVAPFDYLFKGARITNRPTTKKSSDLGGEAADRRSEAGDGYFLTRDYSYRSTRVAGDGWVLVGDAFGFLDPLYSSGAPRAQVRRTRRRRDLDGLQKGDTSATQLGAWGANFNEGVDRMRRLVCEHYDGFSFGKFVRAIPSCRERSPIF